MEDWIRRGLRKAEQALALFTLALRADPPGHDIDAVVARLLSSLDPQRILFAGRLIAESVSVPEDTTRRVVERLFALVRNIDDTDIADEGFEVLGALFGHSSVLDDLDALAGNANIELSRRVSALEALAKLGGSEHARLPLAKLLPWVHGASLQQCAQIAVRLDPEAIDKTAQRAHQLVQEPHPDENERTNAVEVMRILGRVEDVANLARSVLQEKRATRWDLERAVTAWLATDYTTAILEIAVLATERPAHDHAGRAQLAAFLHKAGDRQTAESLAGAVLDDEMAEGDAVVQAVETLLAIPGAEAVPKVLHAVNRWSAEGRTRQQVRCVASILKQLTEHSEAEVSSGSAPCSNTGFLGVLAFLAVPTRENSARRGWPWIQRGSPFSTRSTAGLDFIFLTTRNGTRRIPRPLESSPARLDWPSVRFALPTVPGMNTRRPHRCCSRPISKPQCWS